MKAPIPAIGSLILAGILLSTHPTVAGTMSASPVAPPVDGYDIANYGVVTGTEKWWAENNSGAGSAKGQTFTTGLAAVELGSVTYQISSSQQAQPTKTYVVRVGTVSGSTFTEVHSETFTQNFAWNSGEFMTWTFASPPVLQGNTTYAIDIGLTASTSGWQTGIPYLNVTANDYLGGQRYSSGANGIGTSSLNLVAGSDRVFHLDLAVPAGADFEFIAGHPADDATDALIPPALVATFNKDLVAGTGYIVIRNLTDAIDTPIPVGDSRVGLSANVLTIETAELIDWNKSYAIRLDAGVVRSDTGDIFAGITNDTTWNFTTAPGDPLLLAIGQLKDHINGVITLGPTEIEALKQTIDAEKQRFGESEATITAVFDLVSTYDTVIGPLFVSGSPVRSFSRNSVTDQNFDWVIYHVMQYIMDYVYNANTLAQHENLIAGFKFGSVADFPGAVDPPADPTNTHLATINASFPDTFGRHTQGWTLPARKPTGTYLAPGTIATVTVPPALVGQGYQVRVGAHSWDLQNRKPVQRLERATILYALDAPTIKIASPYGGGIYIEVPFRADGGIVTVQITGAVRAPYFSAKSFHTTTLDEWRNIERHHPAPWADFQSDKFMMQVPTKWIYALDDPDTLMADWDAAMDAINDLMGFPRLRGKETMYLQPDVILRSSVHAPGYPAVNTIYNPNSGANGYANNYYVRGPRSGADIEFHEQGHAYFFPKFGGETEANVNLLYVPVRHRMFGATLDDAFRTSINYGNFHNVKNAPLDNTAVLWMTSFNFAPQRDPMDSWEKAYQPQGHAKWVDFARLFGWDGLGAYWRSYMEEEENGTLGPNPTSTDNLLLRLCRSARQDIRPLFHFWGIHPQNPAALAAAVAAEGLTPSPKIYNLLRHYQTLVPADNAAYQAWCLYWYDRPPSINGYGVEREHARQWDTTDYYTANGWTPQRPNGEIYTEDSAADIRAAVQEIIDLYFTDYTAWSANWPDADLTDPNADLDGDGLTNGEERLWGLDPTSAASSRPIQSGLLLPQGTFTYTRRHPSLTGLSYRYEYSTTLDPGSWTPFTPATETTDAGNPVETVTVSVDATLLANAQLFVRVVVQ